MAKIREGTYAWAVNLNQAQVDRIRKEFPEKDWGNKSELIKTVFYDYFNARKGDPFPPDEHESGGRRK